MHYSNKGIDKSFEMTQPLLTGVLRGQYFPYIARLPCHDLIQ